MGMRYYLHKDGRDSGPFLLEDLRRRRMTGELTGLEHVWPENGNAWLPLDAVLHEALVARSAVPPLPTQVPAASEPPRRSWVPAAVAGGAVMLVGGLMIAVAVILFFRPQASEKKPEPVDLGAVTVPAPAPSTEGLDVAEQPLPAKRSGRSRQDANRRDNAFRLRQWEQAYQEHGDHSRPWDATARRMISAWLAGNLEQPPGTNAAAAEKWGDELAARSDCNDPLVLAVAGLSASELHEAIRRLERARAGFRDSKYPAYVRFRTSLRLWESASGPDQTVLTEEILDLLHDCFTDGHLQPEDEETLAEAFVAGWGNNFFEQNAREVCRRAHEGGKTFAWLALVLDGERETDEAWEARGSGYALSVSEEGWRGFRIHLTAAEKKFSEAWKMHPDRPLAPARMVKVSMGQSDDEGLRLWFDRTLEAQLDYETAWNSMRYALLPKWGGSHEALLALGKSGLDTGRFDTVAPYQFFESVASVESDLQLPPDEHIYAGKKTWPLLARMFEGYIAEGKDPATLAAWRTRYAAVAVLANRYDVARTQLEALDWKPGTADLAAWPDHDFSQLALEVAARTGVAGKLVHQGEMSYRQGDLEGAREICEKVAKQKDIDARTARFAAGRLAALAMEIRLRKGEWVSWLPTATNDPAWTFSEGDVRLLEDGTVEVTSGKNGHFFHSVARSGDVFEVRGEFEVVRSSNGEQQAGVMMGLPNFLTRNWYSLRIKKNQTEGEVASFATAWTRQQRAQAIKFDSGHNFFWLQFNQGAATLSMKNDTIFANVSAPSILRRIPREQFRLGIGAYGDMNETVVRYYRVQVRLLKTDKVKDGEAVNK